MTRKAWTWAGAAAAAVAVAAGVAVAASAGGETKPGAEEAPASTEVVKRGELATAVSLTGTLAYRGRPDGSPYSAINQASGTYTELPEAGEAIRCGDVLYRVDDDPVLLLCGRVPAYRKLEEGDAGTDVRQLNRNLHRLGWDEAAGVDLAPAGRAFTWETEAALAELQERKGVRGTGALALEDAVYLPSAARISKVLGRLGEAARPGAAVAEATSNVLEVQVRLNASEQGRVSEGDVARVVLPDNEMVRGRVDRLGRVAEAAGNDPDAGGATIPAYIRLHRPRQAAGLDKAPVQVEITTRGVKGALSVPVTAVVGQSGGGFAVEVVRDGGQRELVSVDLGAFDTAAGRVAVQGELAPGDQVVVPSP